MSNSYAKNVIARQYLLRGYRPIPLHPNSKKPIHNEWITIEVEDYNVDQYFWEDDTNIGVVLGEASRGLVDIDIDEPLALKFAGHFLPQTASVFGRKGKPRSHWLYTVLDAQKTKQFKSADGMIIEVRGNGGQTVFPGSTHPTGELVRFDEDGDPGETTWSELVTAATKIAVATIAYKHWTKGNRHVLALALSGFLACRGWQENEVTEVVDAIAREAKDEETEDRVRCVRTTFESFHLRKAISWKENLNAIIGLGNLAAFENWVPLKGQVLPPSIGHNQNIAFGPLTDADVADGFAFARNNDLIWAGQEKIWYVRKNKIFTKIDPVLVQGMAKSYLQEQSLALGPYGKGLLSRAKINAVVELSRDKLYADSKTFDEDEDLFGCRDGSVLDLKNQKISHNPGSIVTKQSNVIFDPKAKCPKWQAFLERIFDGNQEIISYLQRAVGYSLSGSTREQELYILIGRGANGKSTFLNTLHRLFGEYATTTPMQTLMDQGKFGTQTNDLASLAGTRLVTAVEGEKTQKLAESKIKLMTGGDTIKCRYLYGEFFQYIPSFKLWLATNSMPSIDGSDDAIWRRLRIIDFPVSIPPEEQDPHLSANLAKELPGILNWAIEGHRTWTENGLQTPEKVKISTAGYRVENDSLGQWLSSCCNLSWKNVSAPMKELIESYNNWCAASGFDAMPPNVFGKELTKRGFESVRGHKGSKRKGIVLQNFVG